MKSKATPLTQRIGLPLDRFIKDRQKEFKHASGDLSQLLRDIGLAAKIINREINRAGLVDIEGALGTENVQGETQKKLDVIANERFIRALGFGEKTCAVVSEEVDDLIHTGNRSAKYVVLIDPVDGSSNIHVNIPIATAFGILRRKSRVGTKPKLSDALQPGSELVAAGYILYGPSTMLVYTTGHGVNGFTYDPSLGEFYLSHPKLKFPPRGNIYSINEAYFKQFSEGVQRYLLFCKDNDFNARYIGSMVSDFHRNLMVGGVFIYPTTSKNPKGKLRLLYECNPIAFLAEQAGGLASNGRQRILDIQPESLHQREPIIVGNREMVETALSIIRDNTPEGEKPVA